MPKRTLSLFLALIMAVSCLYTAIPLGFAEALPEAETTEAVLPEEETAAPEAEEIAEAAPPSANDETEPKPADPEAQSSEDSNPQEISEQAPDSELSEETPETVSPAPEQEGQTASSAEAAPSTEVTPAEDSTKTDATPAAAPDAAAEPDAASAEAADEENKAETKEAEAETEEEDIEPYADDDPGYPQVDGDRVGYRDLNHTVDDLIAEGLAEYQRSFFDDMYDLYMATAQRHIQYVYCTRPELMGLGIVDVVVKYRYPSYQALDFYVTYVDDSEYTNIGGTSIAAYQQRLANIRSEVAALIPAGASDLVKAHVIHDYLITNYAYDQLAVENGTMNFLDFVAPGVFNNHSAVCRGISQAYQYLLCCFGVENALAESGACNHVWNLVKIDGEWYHVDLSSDNPGYDVLGEVSHDYFLISTETLLSRNAAKADFTVLTPDLYMVFTDDTCATSKRFESNQPWSDSETFCYYHGGSLYTINGNSELCKNGQPFFQPQEHMQWHPYGNYSAVYTNQRVTAKLSPSGRYVYMNSPRKVYKVDLQTGSAEVVYAPEAATALIDDGYGGSYTNPMQIFGLARIDGTLYCSIEDDIPYKEYEVWTKIDLSGSATVDPEPEPDPIGFVQSDSIIVSSVALTGDMQKTVTAKLSGIPDGASITVTSSDESIAAAQVQGDTLTVACRWDGTADITVTVNNTVLTASVTVRPSYSTTKNLTVTVGNQITFTDSGEASVELSPEESIADLSLRVVTEPGTEATPASVTKLTSFRTGRFLIGQGGTYLVRSGSALTTTADAENATLWQFSGSDSSLTISDGGYYLSHSSSALSLSASSANAAWQFSGGKLLFKQTERVFFWNSTKTYYLVLGSSFSVSTGSSNAAAVYDYQAGTPGTPGSAYTEISVAGISEGTTQFLLDSTRYIVTVEAAPAAPIYQTVTVVSVDDLGATLAAAYTISGEVGTAYTVSPTAIAGYTTPATVNGVYTEGEATLTLVYVLSTDKSKLAAELTGVTPQGDYTDESYRAYTAALEAGQKVYDRRATQTEVDNALAAIEKAKAALAHKPAPVAYALDSNGIDSGSEYVLVSSGRALAVVNGSLTTVAVTVDGTNIAQVEDTAVWILRSSGSKYTLQNKQSGQYLSYTSSGSVFSRKCTPGLSSSATTWKVSRSSSNMRFYATVGVSSFYLSFGSGVSMTTSTANTLIYKKA